MVCTSLNACRRSAFSSSGRSSELRRGTDQYTLAGSKIQPIVRMRRTEARSPNDKVVYPSNRDATDKRSVLAVLADGTQCCTPKSARLDIGDTRANAEKR